MIQVESLTKRFAETVAVNKVSFQVQEGEIVGFLGPNGAGKTTTMRMLTCFMPATSGSATVAGYDIFRQSLQVRQNVGYLPEMTPLYPEMRVREYLSFRAKIKGVPRKERKARLAEVMEQCAVTEVRDRIVGHLSKGYRQRVGLAEALVHMPKILILDEPTVGLDPNQIRETRQLIKNLGKAHTIMLSTHRLEDVEVVCGRVIIINKGTIIASDTPDNLRRRLSSAVMVRVEARGPGKQIKSALEVLPGVIGVTHHDQGDLGEFMVEAKEDVREPIFQCVAKNGWTLRELRRDALSLEEVFAKITENEQGETGPGKGASPQQVRKE